MPHDRVAGADSPPCRRGALAPGPARRSRSPALSRVLRSRQRRAGRHSHSATLPFCGGPRRGGAARAARSCSSRSARRSREVVAGKRPTRARQLEIAMALATRPRLLLLASLVGIGPDESQRMCSFCARCGTSPSAASTTWTVLRAGDRISVWSTAGCRLRRPRAICLNPRCSAPIRRVGAADAAAVGLEAAYGVSHVLFGITLGLGRVQLGLSSPRHGQTTTVRAIWHVPLPSVRVEFEGLPAGLPSHRCPGGLVWCGWRHVFRTYRAR